MIRIPPAPLFSEVNAYAFLSRGHHEAFGIEAFISVPIYVLPKITDYHKEGFVTEMRHYSAEAQNDEKKKFHTHRFEILV